MTYKEHTVKISVGIAMHKPYHVPDDPMYLPIHVGSSLHPDILPKITQDNTGDNISRLNPYYCELTAIYWLWKNNTSDYKGLVHYRRYFASPKFTTRHLNNRLDRILTTPNLYHLIKANDLIIPRKRYYVIETVYSHYAHTHYASHLDATRNILQRLSPKSILYWDSLMKKRSAHMFNMMIMKRDLFDAYCEWLFPILFELEKKIDPAQYDSFQARYLGRISELLFNVWIKQNKLKTKKLNTVFVEPVDWPLKIRKFLMAKFAKERYGASF